MKVKEQGLYLPEFEHDNCGAGFICNLNGIKSNDIIHKALDILIKLEHRGAVSSDGRTGDGAGILFDIPHTFFKKVCDFEIPEVKFLEYERSTLKPIVLLMSISAPNLTVVANAVEE